jgi:hypothetical protein
MPKKKKSKKGKNKVEPICKNCLCYDGNKGLCKVVILINGNRFNMPVFPDDRCHMDSLGIEVQQVRWWTEDQHGNPTTGKGTVKMEYPDGFFTEPLVPEGVKLPNYFPAEKEKPPLPPQLPPDKPQAGVK